jgi:hypothetical protein
LWAEPVPIAESQLARVRLCFSLIVDKQLRPASAAAKLGFLFLGLQGQQTFLERVIVIVRNSWPRGIREEKGAGETIRFRKGFLGAGGACAAFLSSSSSESYGSVISTMPSSWCGC